MLRHKACASHCWAGFFHGLNVFSNAGRQMSTNLQHHRKNACHRNRRKSLIEDRLTAQKEPCSKNRQLHQYACPYRIMRRKNAAQNLNQAPLNAILRAIALLPHTLTPAN
ncbi:MULTISPECIES: hypothetical protein [Comamonas]|uniref:hypothetical protein n=1 Tax=Comamonas thiooxydans TaxID=363952 RepID=UPI00211494CD|nr:hypothetical protein [Comamonas thiooxydans]UUE95220.1 hypothetical protein MJ608_06125 [Comamonas thiooxydans]